MSSFPDTIQTAVTKMFNIRYPIICAPMFLVSTVEMVVKASEAGGIGTFPAFNYRPIEKYHQAIKDIKSQTGKPFGINIIVQKSNKFQHEQIDFALEEKVPLLITSLGNPKEAIRLAHQVGSKVFCDVVGLEHAQKVADLGADGLIAVASGAGGHAGDLSPFALIPLLREKIDLPIVAAGSIVDGRGMAAALALGASAVYMGTRFIASREAGVSPDYHQAILEAECEDIVNTDRVDGFPGNFIRTPSLEKVGIKPGLVEALLSRSKKVQRWLALSRAARALFGKPEHRASYKNVFSAGHGVGRIQSILTIEEIMKKTAREYFEIKAGMP